MIQMKRKICLTCTTLLFLFSCNNQTNRVINSGVIDIEGGLQNLTRLEVSDFGQTIRFIPLETPDEGLVGRIPVIKVLKIISSSNPNEVVYCLTSQTAVLSLKSDILGKARKNLQTLSVGRMKKRTFCISDVHPIHCYNSI